MRYLKRQTINRRIANDPALYIDYKNANVIMGVTDSLTVPKGTTAQQPGNASNTTTPTPVNGMIRYNSTTDQFEGYQNGTWRSFRFKEATQITQQNLGAGDSAQVYFGPISPISPTVSASGATWGGQNILVVVENVLQLNVPPIVLFPTPPTITLFVGLVVVFLMKLQKPPPMTLLRPCASFRQPAPMKL
jgi:hypothetical protein